MTPDLTEVAPELPRLSPLQAYRLFISWLFLVGITPAFLTIYVLKIGMNPIDHFRVQKCSIAEIDWPDEKSDSSILYTLKTVSGQSLSFERPVAADICQREADAIELQPDGLIPCYQSEDKTLFSSEVSPWSLRITVGLGIVISIVLFVLGTIRSISRIRTFRRTGKLDSGFLSFTTLIAILLGSVIVTSKFLMVDLASQLTTNWKSYQCTVLKYCEGSDKDPSRIVYGRNIGEQQFLASTVVPYFSIPIVENEFLMGVGEVKAGAKIECFANPAFPLQMKLLPSRPISYLPYLLTWGSAVTLLIFYFGLRLFWRRRKLKKAGGQLFFTEEP